MCACVFGGNGKAAAARNFNKSRDVNIKIVFYCCRCHGCSRTVQRFSVDGKCSRNSFHCAAGRDSNVCTKSHFKASFALVRNAAQRNNTGALSVYDTALTRYCRFRQWHVLACCHAHGIGVCKFSHKIIPFKKIVAGRLPRHILHHRHGAEHVGCPDKLPYSVLAAAAVAAVISASCPGVARLVGGHRHWAQLVQQIAVLCRLTCGKLSSENLLVLLGNLGVLSFDALCGHRVKNRSCVGILVVDDVSCASVDALPGLACLRGQVVIHSLDCCAGLAAAVGLLHLHGIQLLHKRRLLICTADFSRHKALLHSVLHTVYKLRLLVETIAQAIVHTVDFSLNVGEIRGQHIAVNHPSAVASTKAAIATPVTAPAAKYEQEQNNNPPRAVASKTPAVAAVGICGLNRHRHYSAVRRKTHVILLSKNIKVNVCSPCARSNLFQKSLKLLRHRLQLVKLLLAHLPGLQQFLHLLFRVALKILPKLLKLLHHLLKLPHRAGQLTAAQSIKQWIWHCYRPFPAYLPSARQSERVERQTLPA
nr:MAG TPA: hypothetical protein [Caudoviricetes sp.]